MPQALVSLASKEYPGRLIIIGQDISGRHVVSVYGITGRSPSSQARRMVAQKDGIWVRPTDEEILKKGNPDLLIYPAILFGQGLVIGNGRQTADVQSNLSRFLNPVDVLRSSLSGWDYEPDEPVFTPRITGCLLPNKRAALSIIRKAEDGLSSRHYFAISLIPGKGKTISTYAGPNIDPLPSFTGKPENVFLEKETAQETAQEVYQALKPKNPIKDFRVSVACIFSRPDDPALNETAIINRSEEKGDD